MVVLGADLHKRSHTIVVIDPGGRQLAEKTIAATERSISSSAAGPRNGLSGHGASRTAAIYRGGSTPSSCGPARRSSGSRPN